MRLAKNFLAVALSVLTLTGLASAQTLRREDDPRNTAPTVGTGGPVGGPTGLFTVYDGQTLRKGEYTFSAAYSNYDRDPGNVDISEVPVSFQIGLSDYLELFFNTDAWRGVKVNSPRNLSGFYLPNSQLLINGVRQTPPAIVTGLNGTPLLVTNRPFSAFPYVGTRLNTVGTAIVVPNPTNGGAADNFPGVGAPVGGILPGLVLSTTTINNFTVPVVSTNSPSYLPDMPFLNRTWGTSAFNTFTVGGKIRFTGPNNPVGFGVMPFYRFYADKPNDASGFNQLQRGASPGGKYGDFGAVAFADARLAKWSNLSANIGYVYNTNPEGDFANGKATLLDRPDEVLAGIGVDFPVNKYFQPIGELRGTWYVGGQTPNAFRNNPLEGTIGARIYPQRWFGFGAWYRHHFNQQDRDSFSDSTFNLRSSVTGTSTVTSSTVKGVPTGFAPSTDPHGFGFQAWIGRRNKRQPAEIPNTPAEVTSFTLSEETVTLPCPEGTVRREGSACSDNTSVRVSTTATDVNNDVLTYRYSVSGGTIDGTGANVNWNLAGVRPGTYSVTVEVDDGCGVCNKATQTKQVTVRECADCEVPRPVCPAAPTVSVNPDVVTQGEMVTFTANYAGNASYNWTVSGGTITSGQGTSTIMVDTTGLGGRSVTGTVELGNVDPTCQNSASATADVRTPATPEVARRTNENNFTNNNALRGELDNFYIDVQNTPNATGVIYVYGGRRTRPRDIQRVIGVINNHIAFRGQDPSRFQVINGGTRSDNNGISYEFYVVPAGAETPTPSPR